MNSNCFILTHYFVRENENEKLDMIEFAIKHIKYNNPDNFVIVAGHGKQPNLDLSDFSIWNNEINESDLGMGHPKLSYKALALAREKGFKRALKIPMYTIILDSNIISFLNQYLENKNILITQETEIDRRRIGDLFMYGDINFLIKIFDFQRWYQLSNNGLDSFGLIFDEKFNTDNKQWPELLKNFCNFENIFTLKWLDLRVSWHKDLKFRTKDLLENKLDNSHEYLWGNKNGKNLFFDEKGSILNKKKHNFLTKDEWEKL